MTTVKGYSAEHLRVRIVYARINTWQGMSLGAIHWMGKLQARGCDYIELTRELTAEQAKVLNRKDGMSNFHKAGNRTTRFLSHNSVQKAAERIWLRCFPLAVLLIEGRCANADPQHVLVGPPDVKKKLNDLVARADKIGYWDRDEKAMQKIAGEWDDIMDKIGKGETGR